MTTPAFLGASRPVAGRWQVPHGWEQGRGAWGGLVVAGLIRATEQLQTDPERGLRAVTCQMLAPLPAGRATVQTTALRRGSATAGIRADVLDDAGRLCATLTAVWGSPRAADVQPPYGSWGEVTMPDVPAWDAVPVIAIEPPMGPAFGANLVYRPISGYPTSGDGHVLGWLGLPDAGPEWTWDPASLVGMVDAWWPAALSRVHTMRPMATVSFAAHLMCDPASVPGDLPLLHEGICVSADQGFSSEIRRLWTVDGRLAVDSFQMIAIIR